MSELNNPGCVLIVGANTGIPGCAFAPDKFVGAILVPKNLVIADADIPTIITKLQELTLAAKSSRIYPVFRFGQITDNTEDVTIETLGYGSKKPVKDGKYDWTFRVVQGSICYQSKLRMFNKSEMKAIFIDAENVLYATRVTGGIAGITLDFFYASPFKANDATNTAIFNVRFALAKSEEFNEKVAFVKLDQDVEEAVKGIIDLELVQLAVVAGKVTVGIRTACDKTDIFESFGAALAEGTLWSVKKAGVTVVITSVAESATLPGWEVNFVGSGEHVITLASPADLAVAEIGGAPENGFEADSLTVTMPAP
jgi:hypothetical protein